MKNKKLPSWKDWQATIEAIVSQAVKHVNLKSSNLAGHTTRQKIAVGSPALLMSSMPYVMVALTGHDFGWGDNQPYQDNYEGHTYSSIGGDKFVKEPVVFNETLSFSITANTQTYEEILEIKDTIHRYLKPQSTHTLTWQNESLQVHLSLSNFSFNIVQTKEGTIEGFEASWLLKLQVTTTPLEDSELLGAIQELIVTLEAEDFTSTSSTDSSGGTVLESLASELIAAHNVDPTAHATEFAAKADAVDLTAHTEDTTIHYTEASIDTDNINEGDTNLFFTDERAVAAVSSDTSYTLVDGSRPFISPIGGVSPVADSDLATKGYIDTELLDYPLLDGTRAFSGNLTISGELFFGPTDVGLKRTSAGVLSVTNGSTGTGGITAGGAYGFTTKTSAGVAQGAIVGDSTTNTWLYMYGAHDKYMSLGSTNRLGWSPTPYSSGNSTDVAFERIGPGSIKITNGGVNNNNQYGQLTAGDITVSGELTATTKVITPTVQLGTGLTKLSAPVDGGLLISNNAETSTGLWNAATVTGYLSSRNAANTAYAGIIGSNIFATSSFIVDSLPGGDSSLSLGTTGLIFTGVDKFIKWNHYSAGWYSPINFTIDNTVGAEKLVIGSERDSTGRGSLKVKNIEANGNITIGAISISTGTGSPEGVVSAGIGSIYTDSAGGIGSTLYIKESGTGNTGWSAK